MANEALSTGVRSFMATMATRATEGLGSENSVSLTYTQQTSRTYAPTSGTESETLVTGAVTGNQLSVQSIQGQMGDSRAGQAGEEVGDTAFVVTRSALEATSLGASFAPSQHDRITAGGVQYEVLRWAPDAARLRYYFVCKRVAT